MGIDRKSVEERLEDLAAELRRDNPGSHVYVDNRAVWLRVGERDLGIYSTILNRDDIYCTVEDGPQGRWTPLSRAVKPAEEDS